MTLKKDQSHIATMSQPVFSSSRSMDSSTGFSHYVYRIKGWIQSVCRSLALRIESSPKSAAHPGHLCASTLTIILEQVHKLSCTCSTVAAFSYSTPSNYKVGWSVAPFLKQCNGRDSYQNKNKSNRLPLSSNQPYRHSGQCNQMLETAFKLRCTITAVTNHVQLIKMVPHV